MTTGPRQDRQPQDDPQQPLPRRGDRQHGRIPTQYAPGRLRTRALTAFKVRPGAPEPPTPEPQQGAAPVRGGAKTTTAFAIRPGLPSDPPPEGTPAPDWELQPVEAAPQSDDQPGRQHSRRPNRLRRRIALGSAAVVVLGGAAATLALTGGHSAGHPTAVASPSAAVPTTQASLPSFAPSTMPPAQPTPSPTLLDPITLLSSATTDTAPLSVAALFPGKKVTVNGHVYTQALTATSACKDAATPPLAALLAKSGCQAVFRATYDSGTAEVTVGIAIFPSAAQAGTVKAQAASGNLQSLFGGPVKPFCRGVVCRLSTDAIGRYTYFTVAGYSNGKPVPANDSVALAAGNDIAAMAFQNLADRGRAEAAAAAQSAR
ncbi:hypothetical protein [Streptacidiphilus fuscans]|uniref:Uncharacterized protein n=1 Tax=Streptacidiphilus fuscans TaxID=2789292 RepID=A0A931FBX6_9ACTN|nr:hypothetical protein [Streptacidiphilus fuscans]MBF9067893.1 hypothetical protein [Streptacidiphilus fuscans]